MSLVELAIPFFFLLIGIELVASLALRRRVYRLNDALSDLGCGLLQQFSGLAFGAALVVAYAAVSTYLSLPALLGQSWWPSTETSPIEGLGLLPFSAGLLIALHVLVLLAALTRGLVVPLVGTGLSVWGMLHLAGHGSPTVLWGALGAWLLGWLLQDCAYYWAHRTMHEVGIGWATHAPHHSSEDYNLAVSLRQGAFQRLFSLWFYLPLAFLGMPWEMFVAIAAITLLYQFWIHTRLIDRIGPLEWVLNTPSHHRVHHGREPRYIDKNHAGTFIVWDRVFGTFEPEGPEPVYGLAKPLNSFNPVWAQLHVFRDLWQESRHTRNLGELWRVWFGPPGWRPAHRGGPLRANEVDREAYRPYDVAVPGLVRAYAFAQFLLVMAAMLATLLLRAHFAAWELWVLAGLFVLSLSNVGELFERRRWAYRAEMARLGALALASALVLLGMGPSALALGVLVWALASMAWLRSLRHGFNRESPHKTPPGSPRRRGARTPPTPASGNRSSGPGSRAARAGG